MIDVALDLPRMRQMSVGMRAYAEELATRLPRVAPDLAFAVETRKSYLDCVEQVDLPRRLRRLRPRLVHHLSVYAPLLGPRPYAITIHDLIHLRYPAHFKRSVGPYYRTIVRAVCARAARVIVDDPRTIGDLERYLGVPPEKVRVVPLGIDETYLEDVVPAPAPRPYAIYAGNRRPHKDLGTLFAAWAALPSELELDLALTGDRDPAEPPPPERARGRVRFLGALATPALASAYAGAVALVYPSLCEGFGLPMLEAAACGTPVIASDSALPGVLRPIARTFAARDTAALGAMLLAVARAPRRDAAGRALARSFTWDRCALATAQVYREILRETVPQ